MRRLFERIADEFPGTCEALALREDYAKVRLTLSSQDEGGGYYVVERRAPTVFEMFPYAAKSLDGATVDLVRVQPSLEDGPLEGEPAPVLVSPLPSAIIAVAMR